MGRSNSVKHHQSGQILLLIILLSMILLTVGLSTVKLTTEETRIAKLETDSKRALAGAEAGIEASLQSQESVNISDLLDSSSGVTGSTTIQPSQSNPSFTTPLLFKDEQYTFYLSIYTPIDLDNPNSVQSFGTPYSGSLKIKPIKPIEDYCIQPSNKFAIELTFINVDSGAMKRFLIDECPLPISMYPVMNNGVVRFDNATDNNEIIDIADKPSHLMLLRVIAPNNTFAGASFEIINNSAGNWPPQGTIVTSTAITNTSVAKKVQVFQSYPQLTTDFWVTSF